MKPYIKELQIRRIPEFMSLPIIFSKSEEIEGVIKANLSRITERLAYIEESKVEKILFKV